MAYYENEFLTGAMDGVNKIYTTVNLAMEVDNVRLNNAQVFDYSFTPPSTIELNIAPNSGDILTASYWVDKSIVGGSTPYQSGSELSSLIKKIRIILGEEYTEEWKDIMLTDWLNEAINVICTRVDFPFMEAEATIWLKAGQESYQLPAGFKKIIGVFLSGGERGVNTYLDEKEHLSGISGYTLFNDSIILSVPSSDGQIKIRYYRYLPYFDYTNVSSVCKIPRQYEDMLIDYAVGKAKQQEELYDVASVHQNQFTRRFDDMVIDLTRRVEPEYPSIKPCSNLY